MVYQSILFKAKILLKKALDKRTIFFVNGVDMYSSDRMETLDELVGDCDQNKMLKVCQKQAFDYLSEKKKLFVTKFALCSRIFRHVVQNIVT